MRIALQFATGFTVAYFVYQIGTFLTTGSVGAGFIPGLIVEACIVAVISYLIKKADTYVGFFQLFSFNLLNSVRKVSISLNSL